MHSIAQRFSAMQSNAQQCTAMHSNAQQCTAMHSSVQQCTLTFSLLCFCVCVSGLCSQAAEDAAAEALAALKRSQLETAEAAEAHASAEAACEQLKADLVRQAADHVAILAVEREEAVREARLVWQQEVAAMQVRKMRTGEGGGGGGGGNSSTGGSGGRTEGEVIMGRVSAGAQIDATGVHLSLRVS